MGHVPAVGNSCGLMYVEFGAGRLRQSLDTWKASFAARQPDGLSVLRPPAGDADIEALRKALDGRWSPQLEALYRENDGEGDTGQDGQLPFLLIPEDPGMSYSFMPLSGTDGVIEELESVNDVITLQRAAGEDVTDLKPDAMLVPFGKDFSGNYLCVALPPPGSEGEGPVFQANHGDGGYGEVARDLAHYFGALATFHERGAADHY